LSGRVISTVAATATVAAGTVLFTMEAMKMEMKFGAPEVAEVSALGTFVAIVSAGAKVVLGDVIGYFFPAEDGDSTLAGCSSDGFLGDS
jgi:acetyl/propionyl-CoA carboxylase alpha subunit